MNHDKTTKKETTNDHDIFFSFKTVREKKEANQEQPETEEEMINIYHQNMPRKFEHKKSFGAKIFIIGLLILIISAGIFYYYGAKIFSGGQIFSGKNVELEIEGLTEVAAGEEITYIIKYQNLEKVDLTDVILDIDYPKGFAYKKAKPLPSENNNSWELGYLRSGKSGQIEITGSLIGDEEIAEKLLANLKYSLVNGKSGGVQKAEIETKISSSILDLEISGPSQLLDENIEYIVKYSNKSNTTVEDIKIIVTYPEGFEFLGSESVAPQDTDNTIFLINQLAGKQSRELIINGRFVKRELLDSDDSPDSVEPKTDLLAEETEASADENKILKIQIGLLDAQDVFYLQKEEEFTTSIIDGDIGINLELNESAADLIINLNSVLTYNVKYINQSGLDLQDVKLKLIINSNILDWTSLNDEAEGVVFDEEIINGMLARSITWEIEEIKPDDENNFIVKVNSKPYSKLDKTNSLDLRAEARIQATIGKIDGEKSNRIIQSNKIIAQVNTNLDLQTTASLQNINEYQIIWQLTNSIHEVEQVKVETDLPASSSWLAQSTVSAGDIYYDPETKKISWQLNRIPVGVDIPLTAEFKVATTASGRPILLTDLSLTAIDKVTGKEIARSYSEVMGE